MTAKSKGLSPSDRRSVDDCETMETPVATGSSGNAFADLVAASSSSDINSHGLANQSIASTTLSLDDFQLPRPRLWKTQFSVVSCFGWKFALENIGSGVSRWRFQNTNML